MFESLLEELRLGGKQLAETCELNWELLDDQNSLDIISEKIEVIPFYEHVLRDMINNRDYYSLHDIRKMADLLLYTYALVGLMERKNTIESVLQSL